MNLAITSLFRPI